MHGIIFIADPFEIKLKQGGLNDKDIRALIGSSLYIYKIKGDVCIIIMCSDDNGFSSMKDLQDLSLEDVDELDGLKKGQKISVKKFLKKLHQQDESSSGQFSLGNIATCIFQYITVVAGFQSTLQLKDLKDVFWKVRANWYLLGIQLDVEHSELEVSVLMGVDLTTCESSNSYRFHFIYSLLCVYGSLVPRLPVFFFIITNKFHYSVANGGNKEKLDACNSRKLGAWSLKF